MREFLDLMASKWNNYTDEEKDVISNFIFMYKGKSFKDGDIIHIKVPCSEYGKPIINLKHVEQNHKLIENIFPNNKVITNFMDIEIISNEN